MGAFQRRRGGAGEPGICVKAERFRRIESIDDVLGLLSTAATLIEQATDEGQRERGRALAAVAASSLRALEIREVTERLDAIEQALGNRKAAP